MSSHESLRYVTVSGVPLQIELHWPFRPSTSGVDWYVMHGTARLLDGSPLFAELSVTMTRTMAGHLPSMERDWAEPLVVNAIRKTVDAGQIAFLKSGKRLPVPVSSRYYSFRTRQIAFPVQPDADIAAMLERKVYWLGPAAGRPGERVWMADPYDAQYVGVDTGKLRELAAALAAREIIALDGDYAVAGSRLLDESTRIAGAKARAVAAGAAAIRTDAGTPGQLETRNLAPET